jgi:hypothetical protein
MLNGKDIDVDKVSKKLHWKKLGPYRVTKKLSNGSAYELDVPKQRQIHNVFIIFASWSPSMKEDEILRICHA